MAAVPTPTTTDGRTARAQRTRAAVVAALLALLQEGNPRPTAKEIAERAGVSLRSVYVHFDDVEDLFHEAAREAQRELSKIVEVLPSDGPLSTRLDRFVTQRVRVWEQLGPVRRAAALQAPFSDALRELLDRGRSMSRSEIEHVFGAELDGRAEALAAVELASSAEAWDQLRNHQGLGVTTATAVVRVMLERVLGVGAQPK